jgi:hypothetical protein
MSAAALKLRKVVDERAALRAAIANVAAARQRLVRPSPTIVPSPRAMPSWPDRCGSG